MTTPSITLVQWLANRHVRLHSLLWSSLFCVCIAEVYIYWLSPNYYYLGFPLADGHHGVVWIAALIVVVSAALLPLKIERLSSYFLWMIFYIVFAPSMLIVPLQGSLPYDGLFLICAIGVSFNVMRIMAAGRFTMKHVVIGRTTFMASFVCLYLLLLVYVFTYFSGHLSLAAFSAVNAQRSEASDVISGTLVGYATGVLSGAFNPFLMAVGLIERRPIWYFLGAAGQLFMYATFALKSVLLSIAFITLIRWFLVTRRPVNSARLGFLVVCFCVGMIALIPLLDSSGNAIARQAVSLTFMRTFGMTGALTGDYATFFANHPLTYYSHINLVAQFVHYPYDQSLGEEVGYSLAGEPLDANANFWATDGIAAAGIPGVLAIGVVVGFFLMIANTILRSDNDRISLLAFVPFIIQVCNTSFFTSLLTGGGAVLLFLVHFWQQANARSMARRNPFVARVNGK